MKLTVYGMLLLILFSSVDIFGQRKVKLPNGTLVVVKTLETYTSDNMKMGNQVVLSVGMDVTFEGDTLIRTGSPVFCVVESAESAGMVGSGGELVISFINTVAIDGSNVQLQGSMSSKGESSVGEKVAVGVILCPLALLCKGEEAGITAGMQARAFTIGEYNIKLEE